MSSVAMIGGGFQAYSPREILQKELTSEVAAGTISATDQSALSSALDDIDSALSASRTSSTATQPPSPDEMKSKIEDLIAGEVSDGKLTSDQAEALKNVFAEAFSGPEGADGAGAVGGPGAMGGPGGPGGAGGPPPPPPSDSEDDTSSSTSSTDSSTTTDIQELMAQFLKSLQETLSQSQSSGYGANGGRSQQNFSALMVDYQA